jgi:glutaredoxin-like protein
MAMLDDATTKKAKEMLAPLKGEVTALIFTSKEQNAEYGEQVKQLVGEVAALNPNIKVVEKEISEGKEYDVDKAPAIVLVGKEKRLVRFFGIPAGYEFSTFIADLIDVANGKPNLPNEVAEKIKKIDFPVHMQVFVTPTCPYCPPAVKAAHDFALLNPKITGDMVEATEFPELSEKYEVMGVPKTVITSGDKKIELTGAYPVDVLAKKILDLGTK